MVEFLCLSEVLRSFPNAGASTRSALSSIDGTQSGGYKLSIECDCSVGG